MRTEPIHCLAFDDVSDEQIQKLYEAAREAVKEVYDADGEMKLCEFNCVAVAELEQVINDIEEAAQ